MTEKRNKLAELFATCWKDDALKARFMTDPKSVLAEYGIDVPANITVNVVENADNCVHITIPQTPETVQELSDEELLSVAGGSWHGLDTCATHCHMQSKCHIDCPA